jgi:outer membrane cobalamin receptor
MHRPLALALVAAPLLGIASAWAQSTGAPAQPPGATAQPQQVDIIGTSPLPGQGVERDKLPYTTQVLRRDAIDAAKADNTTDLLARRLPGVQVNDVQGSPFQADLTFRGYRASGILGASQGLSVYLDGVRINEPFGDVVNWDLLPEFALRSVSFVPGANPAFGLNTLGGAISMTTSTGGSAPGVRGELSYGSFGRKKLELSHGGSNADGLSHFIGAGLFDERGWRDFSAGRLGTVFGKLAHSSDELGDLSASLLLGKSRLIGNNLVPLVTFDGNGALTPDIGGARRQAVYTHPDLTRNRVEQLALNWRRDLANRMTIEALAYQRNTRRTTLNGDEADAVDPGEPNNASINRTATKQKATGASFALSGRHGAHQWQIGTSVDHATVGYEQTEQDAFFDDTRGAVASNEPTILSARVDGRSTAIGVYVTNTWQLAAATHVTGTLRFNHAKVSNTLGSVDNVTGVFEAHDNESFTYRSLNPALGIAQRLGDSGVTVFANVARNNRVPTVIELGCADPNQPCRLPAGLQSDPYLKQVIATSVEGGLRFAPLPGLRGSLALFRSDNRDDVLFRSVSINGQQGYFQNFPRTRHMGLDAELTGRVGPVEWQAGYSHLRATYEADGVLRQGQRNVTITPGTRIAGLPRHVLKLAADWDLSAGFSVGADVQALSRRGTAGNEDGLLEDGGTNAVRLDLAGYALVNLRASWKPAAAKGFEVFTRVSNATDRRYQSFGALAQTAFDAQGRYSGNESDAWFVAPGAPRAFNAGVRWKF